MKDEVKNPEKDKRERNLNQNIEQNRKHGGTGMARHFTREDSSPKGRRDGKR
jgi:hypothetical protein